MAETAEEKNGPFSTLIVLLFIPGHVRLARCFGTDPVWSSVNVHHVSLDLDKMLHPSLPRDNARNERTSTKVSARRSPPQGIDLPPWRWTSPTWTRGPSYSLLPGEAVCQRAPRQRGGRTLTPIALERACPFLAHGGGPGSL